MSNLKLNVYIITNMSYEEIKIILTANISNCHLSNVTWSPLTE